MKKPTFAFAVLAVSLIGFTGCTPNQPSNDRPGTPLFDGRQGDPTVNGQNNPDDGRGYSNDAYSNPSGDDSYRHSH